MIVYSHYLIFAHSHKTYIIFILTTVTYCLIACIADQGSYVNSFGNNGHAIVVTTVLKNWEKTQGIHKLGATQCIVTLLLAPPICRPTKIYKLGLCNSMMNFLDFQIFLAKFE